MLLCWTDDAWADYLYWQSQDRRTLKRVNTLIRDMQRTPFEASASPNPSNGACPAHGRGASTQQPHHLHRRRRQALHPLREGPLLNDMGRNGLYHLIDVFGRLGFL